MPDASAGGYEALDILRDGIADLGLILKLPMPDQLILLFLAWRVMAAPLCLSRSSNQISQKNQTNEMNQRDQMNQLPTTRREMLDRKT